MKKDARRRAVEIGLLPQSVANATRDSAGAKERSGRSLHSVHGQAVSRGQASREGSRDRADFRKRAGQAAEIEAARDLAASGLAGGKS
jgi:hypothetical protein